MGRNWKEMGVGRRLAREGVVAEVVACANILILFLALMKDRAGADLDKFSRSEWVLYFIYPTRKNTMCEAVFILWQCV